MKEMVETIFRDSAQTHLLAADALAADIVSAVQLMADAIATGRKVVAFGNGGSAADAQHFAAELIGRFVAERPSYPAIAFTTDSSILTSVGNDYGFETVFVRQVEGLVRSGDVAVGISTSGKSPNVNRALTRARELGAVTVGLTGRDGGEMPQLCDICLIAPSAVTARIQEIHITIIHALCAGIESLLARA